MSNKVKLENKNQELQERSLYHYEQMIQWARLQDSYKKPKQSEMREAIGQSWGGEFCAYCQFYRAHCSECPLHNPLIKERSSQCCSGWWEKMQQAPTWRLWIKYAMIVVEQIEKRGRDVL